MGWSAMDLKGLGRRIYENIEIGTPEERQILADYLAGLREYEYGHGGGECFERQQSEHKAQCPRGAEILAALTGIPRNVGHHPMMGENKDLYYLIEDLESRALKKKKTLQKPHKTEHTHKKHADNGKTKLSVNFENEKEHG